MENRALPPAAIARHWQLLRKPLELELARGCPDTAIVGTGIGTYTQLWAERLQQAAREDYHLALSIARGLRDYASMPVAERRRRAAAAIDLLRGRETQQAAPPRPAANAAPKSKAARTPVPARAPRPSPAQAPLPAGQELLDMPISLLAPRARWPQLLATKLHLYSVRDLLYHIPREWVDIRAIAQLEDGTRAALVGEVTRREFDHLKSKTVPHPLYKYTLTVTDSSGLEAWVSSITIEPERARGAKPSWSLTKLPFSPGQRVFAMGRVDRTGTIIELRMEDIFEITPALASELRPGQSVPIYPLTNGVFQSQVHRAVLRVLTELVAGGESVNALIDSLPEAIREQYRLLPLVETLQELHRPRTAEHHAQARRRLAFEEFLVPQLLLARRRWAHHHEGASRALEAPVSLPAMVTELAQFTPTPAQLRVLGEIEADLRSPHPMNRMLQGDVGSGKTLIAAGALAYAVRAGYQAAIMAPTEILAEQLYLVITRLLKPAGMTPALLTGTMTAPQRRETLAALEDGRAPIAVGTHALVQDGVTFQKLGLVVVDEQHRFGVEQRATLRRKGEAPHTLVMSATPIPRTLSLTMFGDLDLSILDELPPGRRPVETRWMATYALPEAYAFIRAQVEAGRQAYVLCPLVEQSELLQVDAATETARELQDRIFPDLTIGLLHGRMKPDEKDAAMEAFRTGKTHILACTTVVEVGVDVPNATVILIHNAERFGLAQLHQLRGRVGRSSHSSTCLLITHPRFDPLREDGEELAARRRLRILQEQQDGFIIAEEDLRLRGPGEYLGTRQSGLTDYQIGNMVQDVACLEEAREAAQSIIADDPQLAAPAYDALRQRVQHLQKRLDQFRE